MMVVKMSPIVKVSKSRILLRTTIVHCRASVTPTQHSVATGTGTQVGQALRSLKLHKRPRILTTLFLWLFGLYAVFLSPAPIKITDDKLQRFEKRLDLLAKADRPRQLAQERWLQKDLEVRKAKVRTIPVPLHSTLHSKTAYK